VRGEREEVRGEREEGRGRNSGIGEANSFTIPLLTSHFSPLKKEVGCYEKEFRGVVSNSSASCIVQSANMPEFSTSGVDFC